MSQKKLQLHMAWKEKRRQQQLKAQYGIDRPDVVVVERKNVFVITLRVILHAAYIALRICASCAVAVLAIIGLASLIYPNIRAVYPVLSFQLLLPPFLFPRHMQLQFFL